MEQVTLEWPLNEKSKNIDYIAIQAIHRFTATRDVRQFLLIRGFSYKKARASHVRFYGHGLGQLNYYYHYYIQFVHNNMKNYENETIWPFILCEVRRHGKRESGRWLLVCLMRTRNDKQRVVKRADSSFSHISWSYREYGGTWKHTKNPINRYYSSSSDHWPTKHLVKRGKPDLQQFSSKQLNWWNWRRYDCGQQR